MTDSPSGEITAELASASDADWEADQGLSFVAINALVMQRYLHEYHWQHDDFGAFSINAHANAVHNPCARFQEPISAEDYRRAPMIAEPINLLDASPMGDGAAAALVVPLEHLRRARGNTVIRVAGSAAATDTIAVHSRREPLWLKAAEQSARQAYAQARSRAERHRRVRTARCFYHNGNPFTGIVWFCRTRTRSAVGAGW